jgi:hypothetical protein
MLGLQEATIMGGSTEVIPPLESPEHCVNWRVLEQRVMQVHHTSRSSGDNQSTLNSESRLSGRLRDQLDGRLSIQLV